MPRRRRSKAEQFRRELKEFKEEISDENPPIDIERYKLKPKQKPKLNVSRGKVDGYVRNWGEYFDYLFSEESQKEYNLLKLEKEGNVPKVANWYLYGLEKAGFDLSKFNIDVKIPARIMKQLKANPRTDMKLRDLYYTYWFPLRAFNFKKDSNFSPLSWIANGIYAYIMNDFDYLMIVNGLEGTGKSSLAINLAMRLKSMGLGFNIATHIFFRSTPEDYILNMIENTERQVFIFDEARAHFWKRSSQTKGQKSRIMSLTMQRARNHVYLLCTRQPDDVDVDLRDSRVASVLYSIDKGDVAFLVNRNVGFTTKDPFGFRRLEWLFKHKEIRTPEQLRNEIVNLPSLYAFFKVDGLPEKLYQMYKELKMGLNKIGTTDLRGISKERIVSVVLNDDKILELVSKRLKIDPVFIRSALI